MALKKGDPQSDQTNTDQIRLFESFANSFTSANATPKSNDTLSEYENKLDQILSYSAKSSGESSYLMNKRCVLESKVDLELAKLTNQVKELNERITREITSLNQVVDNTVEFLDLKNDTRMGLVLREKFSEIDIHFEEAFTCIEHLVSDKVNEKITQLDENIAPKLINAGKSIDEKIEKCEDSIKNSIDKIVSEAVEVSIEKYLIAKEFDFDSIMKVVTEHMDKIPCNHDNEIRDEIRVSNNKHNHACEHLSKEIDEIKSLINFLSDNNVSQTGEAVPISEFKSLKQET